MPLARSRVKLLVCILYATIHYGMSWFYENIFDVCESNPELILVDVVYCLDFKVFTPDHWKTLGEIYRGLPGWCGCDTTSAVHLPSWFGSNEEESPHLSASVEPSGLQISGTLGIDEWLNWDEEFKKQACVLPTFEV